VRAEALASWTIRSKLSRRPWPSPLLVRVMPLNLNIKACTVPVGRDGAARHAVHGGKGYLPPESASQQPYGFVVRARQPEYVAVSLSALRGVLGRRSISLSSRRPAVAGKTVVALPLFL